MMNATRTERACSAPKLTIYGLLLCIGVAGHADARSPYHRSFGTDIVVTSAFDRFVIALPGERPPCTLRDAIKAANDNIGVGGCAQGLEAKVGFGRQIDHVDRIVFDLGPGTPTIHVRSQLPPITDAVSIDGATGGASRVVLDGSNIVSFVGALNPVHGLILIDQYSAVENMVIQGFSGNGLLLTDISGDGHILTPPTGPEIEEPTLEGGASSPGGDVDIPNLESGGGYHYVAGNLIGTDATGNFAEGNGSAAGGEAGIAITTHSNLIGGPERQQRNVISGNRGHGVIVGGTGNRIEGNLIGADLSGVRDLPNQWDGIHVSGGRFSAAICTVVSNTIAFNVMNGLTGGFNHCAILNNAIFENGELGIDMAHPGSSLNDPTGARVTPPNAPELQSATLVWLSRPPFYGTQVAMEMVYRPNHALTIELFHNDTCDPSGYGEGQRRVGTRTISIGGRRSFSITVPGIAPDQGSFTASATVPGNFGQPLVTSEFSNCLN